MGEKLKEGAKNLLTCQVVEGSVDKPTTVLVAGKEKLAINSKFYQIFREYQELSVRYDGVHRAVWVYYKPGLRPCFSEIILREALAIQRSVIAYFQSINEGDGQPAIRFLVQASQVPGIFNLGGDLDLFVKLIVERDGDKLFEYAKNCVDICYLNAVNLNLPITTISLVTGLALGGGFEAALSGSILIAEKNSEMGFPEIRFNLFPGMGAYSLLARIAGGRVAEKMIASGRIYSAWELYEMNVVHEIADTGQGVETVERFMRQMSRVDNGFQALQQVKQRVNPINYEELIDVTRLWVEAALRLTPHDLRMMEKLVNAQIAKVSPRDERRKLSLMRTRQDRRFIAFEELSYPFVTWSGEVVTHDRRRPGRDRRGTEDSENGDSANSAA